MEKVNQAVKVAEYLLIFVGICIAGCFAHETTHIIQFAPNHNIEQVCFVGYERLDSQRVFGWVESSPESGKFDDKPTRGEIKDLEAEAHFIGLAVWTAGMILLINKIKRDKEKWLTGEIS